MTRYPFPDSGLYLITAQQPPEQIVSTVAAAIAGGAVVVQYRDKSSDSSLRRAVAKQLLACCHASRIPLIINDDCALASEIGADGVHLGEHDGAIAEARQQLGDDTIIGISCYASLQRAESAWQQGASYVAFGRFFPSLSKPLAPPVEMTLPEQFTRPLPVVAIGGITAANGGALLAAGADLLAVIDSVCGADDVTAAAVAFRPLFEHSKLDKF